MFGFGKPSKKTGHADASGPRVSARLCADAFNGRYPHVGLYDCRERKVWVCKPLDGQAIRTSHAALITGANDAMGTVWKDRFLCFWFFTPDTGSGLVLGRKIDWTEAQLQIRIDPQWDYDRQRLIPPELSDQVEDNRRRQIAHGERIIDFYRGSKLKYPFTAHFVASTAAESAFEATRVERA